VCSAQCSFSDEGPKCRWAGGGGLGGGGGGGGGGVDAYDTWEESKLLVMHKEAMKTSMDGKGLGSRV
jgi:hypothetical protein